MELKDFNFGETEEELRISSRSKLRIPEVSKEIEILSYAFRHSATLDDSTVGEHQNKGWTKFYLELTPNDIFKSSKEFEKSREEFKKSVKDEHTNKEYYFNIGSLVMREFVREKFDKRINILPKDSVEQKRIMDIKEDFVSYVECKNGLIDTRVGFGEETKNLRSMNGNGLLGIFVQESSLRKIVSQSKTTERYKEQFFQKLNSWKTQKEMLRTTLKTLNDMNEEVIEIMNNYVTDIDKNRAKSLTKHNKELDDMIEVSREELKIQKKTPIQKIDGDIKYLKDTKKRKESEWNFPF